MTSAWRWVLLAAVAAGFGWLGMRARLAQQDAASPSPAAAGIVRVAPGDPAPDLRLEDLRTGEIRAVLAPGRVRLLNYWASWCGPCREEMPVLQAFSAIQGANGVEVVGIALDHPEDARRFIEHTPVTFPLFVEMPGPADSSEILGNARGILPFSVLIAADGTVLKTHYGAFPDRAAVDDWTAAD